MSVSFSLKSKQYVVQRYRVKTAFFLAFSIEIHYNCKLCVYHFE